jgi:hypothetical protein
MFGVTDPEGMGEIYLTATALKPVVFGPIHFNDYMLVAMQNLAPLWISLMFYLLLIALEKRGASYG